MEYLILIPIIASIVFCAYMNIKAHNDMLDAESEYIKGGLDDFAERWMA